MKHSLKTLIIPGSTLLIGVMVLASSGHLHLPGHGNRENKHFEEAVISHVQTSLDQAKKVEFGSKSLCKDYRENGEVRFSAQVTYYLVSENGVKERHIAHVVCNEDKDKIIEWNEIKNNE